MRFHHDDLGFGLSVRSRLSKMLVTSELEINHWLVFRYSTIRRRKMWPIAFSIFRPFVMFQFYFKKIKKIEKDERIKVK